LLLALTWNVIKSQKQAEKARGHLIKAADMMIAATCRTRARADFATWKMMAKLNGASACPRRPELPCVQGVLDQMPEEKRRRHHQSIYRAIAEMAALAYRPMSKRIRPSGEGHVTAFAAPAKRPNRRVRTQCKAPPPVALNFACLVVGMSGSVLFAVKRSDF